MLVLFRSFLHQRSVFYSLINKLFSALVPKIARPVLPQNHLTQIRSIHTSEFELLIAKYRHTITVLLYYRNADSFVLHYYIALAFFVGKMAFSGIMIG